MCWINCCGSVQRHFTWQWERATSFRVWLVRLRTQYSRDDEFVSSLKSIDLYNRRNHLAKLTLTMIENSFIKGAVGWNYNQIEHIMPQTLTNKWSLLFLKQQVQLKYGNTLDLTLTGYNSELSNKLFEEKTHLYRNSNIKMTRELFEKYTEWSESTIIDRANRLSQITSEYLEKFRHWFLMWNLPQFQENIF